ncbi:hypothetical protein BC936DRAFT_140849 [Jimgerdemannia flammicorona]|uniref:VWFA domain-containing protein n=1 Tax=Jimgerdemannia flammicorona TaxID=994334 RepID=A0A433A3G0_9FUNG|nr:hypothetical protein BC936DRAFT_140849 [Jimgerdemannia flammicorona]
MFTARLAIVIKDVPKQDRAGIVQEFKSKFAKIVSSEGDNNFISRLYQGQMSILPWPIFNEPGFYTALTGTNMKSFYSYLSNWSLPPCYRYLDASKPKFGTARIFLPTVKTIMAKLKVCDWSSLDDNMVRNRALTTRFLIKQVIATGMEEVEPTIEPLKNRESGAIIEDKPATFLDVFGELEMAFDDHEIMPDSGFILLSESNILFRDLSSQVRSFFESNAQERSTALEDAEWYELYTTFVEFIVDRRIGRARQWFSVNTARFPSDHTEIAAASYELEQESEKLVATWSLCGLTCATCNLRCLDQSDHLDEHDCFTNHYCHHNCYFAEEHNLAHETSEAIQIPLCKLLAGHDGFHVCRDSDHLCGESCALYGRSNCQSTCTKPIGHEDESHQCASRIHYCGEPCSLRDVKDSKAGSQFSCNNACTVSYGEPHEIHQCENDTACPLRCCMPQCNKKCSSTDHFHALNNLAEHHICGEEHQCFEECECDGICEIKIQPQAQEESYVNKHGTFTYTKSHELIYIAILQWEQTSKRITCYMKIPAGQLTHTGKHVHAPIDNIFHASKCITKRLRSSFLSVFAKRNAPIVRTTVHFRMVIGRWSTTQATLYLDTVIKMALSFPLYSGNMIQTVFSAVDDEFEHEGFKFNTGDRGSAFLCKMFCKSLGRHRHVDYCKSEEHASCNTEGTQHITKRIDPNPDRAKDYVKHALYWKRTGFKDPYTKEEQEIFGKCDALCCSEEHQLKANQNASGTGGDGAMNFVAPTKSYCELPIFHSPFPRGTAPPNGVGYVSADGHHFKCRNPAGASSSFHIIFAVDRSASMKNKDVRPLHHSPIANLLRPRHDNRLGAVYDAVYRFMEARQTTSRNRAAGGSELTSNDRVSLLLFNEKATTVFVNRPIVEHTELMAEMLKYHAMEGTFFGAGIRRATEILVQHHDPSRIPFIIFLSDGGSNYPRKELQQLFQSAVRVGAMPFLSTVLFGCGAKTNDSMLKSISDFADNQHKLRANPQQQGTSNEKLRCQFYNALDTIQLVEHFTGIAQSLKEHKPALLQG